MRNAWVFPSISQSMKKCSKTHRVGKAWKIGTNFFLYVGVFSLYHMENAWISPSVYHSTWKCSKTLWKGRTRKLDTHTFSKIWVLFFHQIPNPMVYFITWVMHRFSHQFLIASENTAKLILWETPILFLKYGYFSFIKFPRCSY